MIVYSIYKNFLTRFASKFVHFLLQSLFCLSGPDKYRKSKLYTTSQDPQVWKIWIGVLSITSVIY